MAFAISEQWLGALLRHAQVQIQGKFSSWNVWVFDPEHRFSTDLMALLPKLSVPEQGILWVPNRDFVA
jgi:hypothetical protein